MADVTPAGECMYKQSGSGEDVIQCTFLVSGGALAGEWGGAGKARRVGLLLVSREGLFAEAKICRLMF